MSGGHELNNQADGARTNEDIVDAARVLCPAGQDMLELRVRGVPRWFVPLNSPRSRYNGLAMYPAASWRARAYQTAMSAWLMIGGGRLTHHGIFRRGEGWPLGELLLPDMPALATAAVHLGTLGPEQKITVQLMDDRGSILGFAKYADILLTRDLIANEARMLELIPKNVGPSLVRFTPFFRGDLLVQTPLPGRTRVPRLQPDEAQMRLLERLVRSGKTYVASEHPFIKSLYERADGRRSMLERIVEDFKDSVWPIALAHGDLSPWNMRWWRGSCLAFDWEHGREEGLAYLEAAHAPIQTASLIRGKDPRWAKRAVSDGLRSYLPTQLSKFAPAVAALSALNMLIRWYPPRQPDDFEHWLTTFVESPS